VVWYFPSFSELSTVHCDPHKDFGVVNKAEDIKKKWQEYIEELYKKDLHDLETMMV